MTQISIKTIGIDISFKTLDICIGEIDIKRNIKLSKPFRLPNTTLGFEKLLEKIKEISSKDFETIVVMEATGIYHENLAYYLTRHLIDIAIILPNVISNYMKSLSLKQLDDKICARAIAQFGLERKLSLWKAPNPNFRKLRELTRERSQIIQERTQVKNKLHAINNKVALVSSSIQRTKDRIAFLEQQEQQINQEIHDLVNNLKDLKSRVSIIQSIPGIGFISAVTILAETSNFDLIKNRKQLTSYAGLDIIHKVSGTSINSKKKISKKGNKYLRSALHFPALTAIRYNQSYKETYMRITVKTSIKMKGVVAIQRKILELSYSLIKKNEYYIKDYKKK